MRPLWTLVKVALAIVIGIPVAIILFATALGIFGALLGLAIMTLKLAVVGLLAWGMCRLLAHSFGSEKPAAAPVEPVALPPRDPHYEAALRELDRELGVTR